VIDEENQGDSWKEPTMWIIGCDFHPSFQVVAIFDNSTSEIRVRRLGHRPEAERFYREEVPAGSVVGVEACGYTQWFEQLLYRAGVELVMGDAARIRASVVRAQKTDRRDAEHILSLLLEQRFPRIWMPTAEERDLRQLLVHRHKLVRQRTQVKNQLQAMALNQGMQKKRQLWTAAGQEQFQALPLLPYADRRRRELLEMLGRLDPQIAELERVGQAEAEKRTAVRHLMRQQGVGWQTALAMVLTLGPVERFHNSKQVASYLGLIPREHSSGGKQRLGHISKQGNSYMRFLLVEAGQSVAKHDAAMKQDYVRWTRRCGKSKAKVAVARKLAVRLYWMLRERADAA
jgi:transposase